MKNLKSQPKADWLKAKKIKKSAKRILASFLMVTTVMWSFGPALMSLVPVAKAAAPTVLVVEQVNPSAVEVIFSEAMDSTTAQNPSYYAFSGGLTVVDAVQQGPDNIYRIVADGEITAGVTTLTITADVKDAEAEAFDITTNPQTIVKPVKVKISEVSANMGDETAEFIEIYNAGSSSQEISGWKLQYKTAIGGSFADIVDAVVPASTFLEPGKFYLFLTSVFDTASAVDGDVVYAAGLETDGGHIKLIDGSSTEIDRVGWGTADTPETSIISAHSAGESLERKAFGNSQAVDMASGGMDDMMGNGWDTGDNSFDFVVQASPNPQNSSSATEQPDFSIGGGPMIMHMPISSAVTGADLHVIAQMGDPMTPINSIVAELHYMIGDGSSGTANASDFTTILGTHQSNGFFKFIVPQATMDNADTTTHGLYYYLKVVTDGGTAFMSTNPGVDTASVGSGLTYADVTAQEVDVVKNPFITSVAAASGSTFAITGTITDGSAPIQSVLVFAEGTGYSANTNSSGVYSITVPDNDIYNIIMIKDGYFEEWISDIFVNGGAVTVNRTMFSGSGGGMTGDSEKPMVMWTGPPDGMMGVPSGMADFKIFIGFSKDLDTTTFDTSSVILSSHLTDPLNNPMVEYTAEYNPIRTEHMPPENMDPYLGVIGLPLGGFEENKTYYLIMNGTIRDTAGNALQGNRPDGGHMISFTAGGTFNDDMMMTGDFGTGAMMPPFVMGTNPSGGAMNVVTNAKININFSDSMDSISVNSTNIKLYKVAFVNYEDIETEVSLSSVSLDTAGKNATLVPASALVAGKYRIAVSGALKSATGIWMGDPGQGQHVSTYRFYQSGFEVGTTSDSTKPTVLGSWPANSATGIDVNPGMMTIQFSEGMDPSTINSNTITLKRGTSAVTGNISYDPMSQSASFAPSVVLAVSTDYTLTVTTGVKDAAGNAFAANNVIIFTTSGTGDSDAPSIMFANGDEYGLAITFSEAMNSANVADSANYPTSVLNPANYIIKWGEPSDVSSAGTEINLSAVGAQFKYDGMSNTVMIDNLGLTYTDMAGKDYYVNMGSGSAADLSDNLISAGSGKTFQMPINNSFDTQGMLGPMMGGGGMMGPDMGMMGMMGAGVFPMNGMAGQTTIYFVDLPTTKAMPNGGKLVLTFPVGFDVSGAKKDPYSPVNNDINEWNSGIIAFGSATESSGGANNDGVTVDESTRTITITFAVSGVAVPTADFLHLDLAGIINSSIPRGFETSGYMVDMKTMDASGNLLETITAIPFFINAGGSDSLEVTINGVTATDGGDVTVFLGSPMTGPMEQTATFNGTSDTSKTVTFSGLLEGQYMLFTEPTITLGSTDYSGMPMPQPITVDEVGETKTISLTKEDAGAVAAITVNITGIPNGDEIDVFAGSPTGFKVKTLTGTGSPLSTILYLPTGNWMVGVGPAMPKGPMAGPPPMPDWMPPMPTTVVSTGTGTQTLNISISTADMMNIIGYVQDGAGNMIADAEAFAYQPMGMGMGSHTKTDTNGKFTLKVATAGTYSVGVFKPGLPGVPDRTVKVGANTGAADGNSTADITVDGSLITETASEKFIFKIQKPDWTISGKVTNGTNPVPYAPVWAYQPNGMGHAETTTDASGNYILYVANGSWVVQSYIPGFGDSQPQTVVVNGASITQNLSPDSSVDYYTISGTVNLNGSVQTYMPIRAVKYDDNGNYTGQEYSGQTDASGVYSISVPPGKYRVDIWTPEFGEVEITNPDTGLSATPANVEVVDDNKTGKNIIISADDLKTVDIKFTNGANTQTGMVNIDGANCLGSICNPTGFHKTIKLSDLSSDSSVKLPVGDYLFFLDVPGAGFFIPDEAPIEANTKHCIEVVASPDSYVDLSLTDNTVEFDLPLTTGDDKTVFTVTGTITGAGAVEGAWVWMGNPSTGVQVGDMTDGSGNYSITVKAGDYKMGVEMPGYAPQKPTDVTVTADATLDYALTATDQAISGRIYADANSDGYTSGEEIANGWVWAEETTTKQIAGVPTGLDGTFSIGVVDGTYILRGAAEGYSDVKYGNTITVNGSGSVGNNINLTVDSSWSIKIKSKPMTPASGGTLDDSLSTGTGIKVVAPPNAFGSETSSGTIKTKEVSSVAKTSSAEPLGGKGKEITAQNNSGQAITTLNSDIEIELNYYKEDITEAGLVEFDKLKTLTNSYWDVSINDWVPISTTKRAFTKANANDAEWTAQTDFNDFVDDINTYGDYKITLQSTTAHLTIFGATTPSDLTAPSAPSGLSQTAGNGTSVVLDWTGNSEADLMEYEIYRSTSSGVTAVDANQVNTSQVAVSTFTDSTTTAWTSYYYTVTAADDSGNESGVATEIQVCSNSTVSNGTVDAVCSITCDTGYTQSGNSCAAAGGSPVSSSVPSSPTGQAAATPSAGGTISKTNSDGTSAKVVLPAGALLENATITVSPNSRTSITASRPVSAGNSVVGNYVYNFTAVSGLNTLVNTFEKALTLTFAYTNEQAEGLNEETLKIYYWNETSNEWVVLEDSAVDTVNNRVTATTTHFTYFVILGSQTGEETGDEETTHETTSSAEIIDGDIIQCQTSSNPFAVYIVKTAGDTKYIRHIVSLEIFNYYGHLKWENLKQVDFLDEYSLSGWARVNTGPNGTPGPTDKVYEINGDQSKHWINMTAEDFLTHGGSEQAIYTVNQGELDLYTTGADVMML